MPIHRIAFALGAAALALQAPAEAQDRAVAVPERGPRAGAAARPAPRIAARTPGGPPATALEDARSPENTVLFENARVRVQHHDVAPGETTPLHSHPAYVAYVFGDYTGKAMLADGREIPLVRRKGDVFYNDAVTHRITNTGTTPIHNLVVELKEPAPAGARPAAPAAADPTVRLQNGRVRVRLIEVPAGGTEPMHSHPAYVGYAFETYTARARLADGSGRQMARKAGDAFFSEAITHEVVVTSPTPLRNLIVELLEPAPPAAARPE